MDNIFIMLETPANNTHIYKIHKLLLPVANLSKFCVYVDTNQKYLPDFKAS